MSKKPLLSIVIPALNEEKNLPTLFSSIKKQTFKNYEIIVSVSPQSTDQTKKMAQNLGAITTKGGNIPQARNSGTKASQGKYLLFLDADIFFAPTFIQKLLKNHQTKNLDFSTTNYYLESPYRLDKLITNIQNFLLPFLSNIWPFVYGPCTLTTREVFYQVGGYNPHLHIAEDQDIVRRAKKLGFKTGFCKTTYFKSNTRRQDKEGRLNLVKKYFLTNIYNFLGFQPPSNKIPYDFTYQPTSPKLTPFEQFLEKLLTLINYWFGKIIQAYPSGGMAERSNLPAGRQVRRFKNFL